MPEDRQVGHKPKPNQESEPKGTNWLLVIGIDGYQHHRHLKKAVADAQGFADVMTKRYGFKHLHEPLYNEAATRRNILQALSLCETLDEHDRLIVFYAGHGWYKHKTQVGYIVPTKADNNPHTDFIATSSITDIFKDVDAKHILLIVDCCFGGSFGAERTLLDVEMTQKVNAELDTKRSRMVLSSGGITPVSDGFVSASNSPFTTPLLDILQTNKAPVLVLSEVICALRKRTYWETDQQMAQYKVLQGLQHGDGELGFYCTDVKSDEERAYEAAIQGDDIVIYEDFLYEDKFINSLFKSDITRRLKEKRASNVWKSIENSDKIEDFIGFSREFSHTPFANLVEEKIEELKKKRAKKIQIEEIKRKKQVELEKESVLNDLKDRELFSERTRRIRMLLQELKRSQDGSISTEEKQTFLTKFEAGGIGQADLEKLISESEISNKKETDIKDKQKTVEKTKREEAFKKHLDGLLEFFGLVLVFSGCVTFIFLWLFSSAFEGHSNTYKYIFALASILFAISFTLSHVEYIEKKIANYFRMFSIYFLPLSLIFYTLYSATEVKFVSHVVQKQVSVEDKLQRQAEEEIMEGENAFNKGDWPKAFKLLSKNKDNISFDSHAQCTLGLMYDRGKGVEQNYSEAIKLYQKAVEDGNLRGQMFLAESYESGNGVTKDITEAVRLYRLAAAQGDQSAKESLKRLGYTE